MFSWCYFCSSLGVEFPLTDGNLFGEYNGEDEERKSGNNWRKSARVMKSLMKNSQLSKVLYNTNQGQKIANFVNWK